MNILAMGINLWQDNAELSGYESKRGHAVRTLGAEGEPGVDYHFAPDETTAQVVERISREWPVDLLLCSCPELYPPPLEVEHCPVRTVAVISDWNLYQPQLEHNLARYDVAVSDKRGSMELRIVGIKTRYWGPIYSHRPRIHRDYGLDLAEKSAKNIPRHAGGTPLHDTPFKGGHQDAGVPVGGEGATGDVPLRDIDVGFYGNLNPAAHPRRIENVHRLATLGDRWRVEISGYHTQEDYAGLLNRTRIAFNGSIRGEMNLRCFEAPACGALLFIERDNLEAGEVFTHGETAIFYTDDDLLELMERYLSNEPERARIARAGQELIHEWRAVNRLDAFFDWLAEQPASGRPYHQFDEDARLRADALQYSSALPSAQQILSRQALERWVRERPDEPAALLASGCHDFESGMRDRDKGQMKRAGELFSEAGLRAPLDAAPYLNLALLMAAIRQPESARKLLHQALQYEASHALAAFILGKNTDPAYIALRFALALGECPTPHAHAMAQGRMG
ncbi:MAG: hypothetical protein RLZZ303_93 [Candidatus Hydrogenedentota bacterium]|jgi:tetratricopeptide (TPR) repeat protein